MALPHQIPAAGMGGKGGRVSRGSAHGDVKLPLFSTLLAQLSAEKKGKHVPGTGAAEQGVCPRPRAGAPDPCLGRWRFICTRSLRRGRAWGASSITSAPKQMRDSPSFT